MKSKEYWIAMTSQLPIEHLTLLKYSKNMKVVSVGFGLMIVEFYLFLILKKLQDLHIWPREMELTIRYINYQLLLCCYNYYIII